MDATAEYEYSAPQPGGGATQCAPARSPQRLRVSQPRGPQIGGPAGAQVAQRLEAESRRRERRLRHSLALADVAALGVGLLLTARIAAPDEVNPIGFLLFPAVIAISKILGLYDSDGQRIRKTTVDELPRLGQLGILLVLCIWLGDQLILGGPAGKGQAVIFGLTFVGVAVVARRTARLLASRRPDRERCVLIGDAVTFARLRTIFMRHERASDLVGRASLDAVLAELKSAPGDEPARAARGQSGASPHHRPAFADERRHVRAARGGPGGRCSRVGAAGHARGRRLVVDFDDLYGVTLLGVRRSTLSQSSRVLKRSFDLVGAAVLTLLAAPIMAAIAMLIRLDSPGPVLFRQARIGRDGAPFRIFKFRTMVADADALKPGLLELNEAVGLFKIAEDPRMARIGRVLRRTSLDELPQLFDVLRGSMSLVGPRPLVADEDGRILGARRGRLRLTPA